MLNYDKELAEYLIERGATVDAHAAAGLDLSEKLAELIREDPESSTPWGATACLHSISPRHPELLNSLLTHGADINLRDRDHNGTPAQWTMRRRPEVCRYLLEQGAEADIVLYCAMGDVERARAEFEKNPELLKLRINVKSPKGYVIPPLKSFGS